MTFMKNATSFLIAFTIATTSQFVLAENAMLTSSKLLVDDSLTQETWDKHWKKAVGEWRWDGDAMKGFEVLEQNHHAGAGRIQSMQSAIIELEFRMDKSNKIQVGTDYTDKTKKDHLMRVAITPKDLSVRAGSGWGKTTRYKPVGPKINMPFKPGQWYKVKMEFHKQDIVVHINDKVVFCGTAQVNQDVEKNRIALNAKGVASFRHVKVWSGNIKDNWEQTKQKLIAETKAKGVATGNKKKAGGKGKAKGNWQKKKKK